MYKSTIGTIISGTMRTEDLIPAFIDELERLNADQKLQYIDVIIAEGKIIIENKDWDSEKTNDFLNGDLFEALNDFAPSYCSFGSSPGDGADYGFWVDEDILYNFDGIKVDDTSEVPENYNGEVLHVNDHGNLTLYSSNNGELTEIWAIV